MNISVNSRECTVENWRDERTKREYWEIMPAGTAIISRVRVVVRTYKIRGKHMSGGIWIWCVT